MTRECIKRFSSLILVLLWLCVIFGLSSADVATSDQQSKAILGMIVSPFVDDAGRAVLVESINGVFRECAHFIEYFVLGTLLSFTLRSWNCKRIFLAGILFAVSVAFIDEVYQGIFVGRAFQILDIMLDCLGAAVGLEIVKRIVDQRNNRNNN